MWKLRIGIGRPMTRDFEAVAKYVMESFNEEELQTLTQCYTDIYQELIQPLI